MRRMTAIAGAVALTGLTLSTAWAQVRETPYYASISAGKARMRTGPGRNYPASWLYVRSGLPVKVVGIFKEWRKVEDPGGTQGWMQANLLTERRTAIVVDGIASLRAGPRAGDRVLFRAAPGVVGRVSRCDAGWCWFDASGRAGFVETSRLWGVDPSEVVE